MPSELLEAVLGRGWESLRRLEAAHGVLIHADLARGEPLSRVKFRGTDDGVRAAVAAVRETIERERRVEVGARRRTWRTPTPPCTFH